MTSEGPPLEALARRLAESPADFLTSSIHVTALAADLLRDLGQQTPPDDLWAMLAPTKGRGAAARSAANRLQLISLAVWLLSDPWFARNATSASSVWLLLAIGLDPLAEIIDATSAISDADRREELVRFILWSLELRPAGETHAQAQDRLTNLDSVERVRVVRETRAAEERARQIREAMAAKAAEEAAASYGRE